MQRWVLIFCAAVFISGCGVVGGEHATQIRELRSADVVAEVQAAIKSGDTRFVGVQGFGLMVPGVVDWQTKYPTRGIRVIQNTSDAITSDSHKELQDAAYDYAVTYNRELLKRLKQGKP